MDVLRSARLRTAYKSVECLAVRKRLPVGLGDLIVMDAGSGIGQQTALLSEPNCRVIGVDSNLEALCFGHTSNYRASGSSAVACDIGQLAVPDESVDIVVSFGVLEHVDDADEVLRAFHRALRAGGQLALTADCMRGVEAKGFPLAAFREAFDVKNLYDLDTLYVAVTDAGFEVVEICYLLSSSYALGELESYLAGAAEPNPFVKLVRVVATILAERRERSAGWGQFVLVNAVRPA